MDSAKLRKILSVIAVIVLIIIVIYNSGLFSGGSEPGDQQPDQIVQSQPDTIANGQNETEVHNDSNEPGNTEITGIIESSNNEGSNNTVETAQTGNQDNNGDHVDSDENKTEEQSLNADSDDGTDTQYVDYRFRTNKLLTQHYEKHGIEMGFDSKESYEKAASDVINNPAALHKTEAEDGDYVYYIEETNEFVILSQDGYIRTYFLPSAGKAYYDRQ